MDFAAVDDFLLAHLGGDDAVLAAALARADAAGLPAIAVSAPQGKFLYLLARLVGARRILEVGTLAGYSTIWLARGLADGGHLDTIEIDAGHAAVATANFADAGLTDCIALPRAPPSTCCRRSPAPMTWCSSTPTSRTTPPISTGLCGLGDRAR